MGTGRRQNITDITEDLVKHGPEYNIWQAIRIGEIISRRKNPTRKDYLFEQTGLSFRPFENYEYPPTDLRAIEVCDDILTYIINFMGLYGINSPLPRCYHEQISMQKRLLGSDEVPLKNFLDIFNNRFYWLYYQAWKKYKYHLFISEGPDNKVTQRINSFIGRGFKTGKAETAVQDHVLLKFSGIFSSRVRNKAGLRMIMSYLFPSYNIRIKEFIPRWIEISDAPATGDENFALGNNSFLGRSVVDYMSRIGIEFETLTFSEYLGFLPGSRNCEAIKEVLNLYLNDGIEYDISFRIKAKTIETVAWNDERLRLGSTIWLGRPETEFFDVKINYEEYVKRNSS